jgi:hypothetical protein
MLRLIGILGVMLAVLALGSIIAIPTFAAPQGKSDVCHYQDEDVVDDEGNIVDPLGWRIININDNALSAHVGVHTDGSTSDFVINDGDEDDTNDTEDCEALTPFIPKDDD